MERRRSFDGGARKPREKVYLDRRAGAPLTGR